MKLILKIFMLLGTLSSYAQTPKANELIKIHSISDLNEMNSIASPIEGSIIFRVDDQHTYQYSGTEWQKLVVDKEIVKSLTTSYTLREDDDRCALTFNSAVDIVLTVPSGFSVGYNVSIYQTGVGKITITGSNTRIKNRNLRYTTAGLDAAVGLLCTSSNVFHLSGDLKR